jgi:hypothetical protein
MDAKTVASAVAVAKAVAETIKELGSVPSGHLYARLMDRMSLETYNSIIDMLTKAGLIKVENFLITWIG